MVSPAQHSCRQGLVVKLWVCSRQSTGNGKAGLLGMPILVSGMQLSLLGLPDGCLPVMRAPSSCMPAPHA